jgi:aspartyl-tRNA(Asn)/glutamyl-tRNA(Gln) amidotransferase subunit A
MTTAIFYSDATKLAELIRNREISPVEVMQAHLDRIEAANPKINAIVSVAQGALEAARAAEAAVLAGASTPSGCATAMPTTSRATTR